MTHISEYSCRLKLTKINVDTPQYLESKLTEISDVCMVILPSYDAYGRQTQLLDVDRVVKFVGDLLGDNATLITVGEVIDLVHVHKELHESMQFHHWISIKRQFAWTDKDHCGESLPHHHFGALIQTKYQDKLLHTITRVQYAYCPMCDKTTKDYGGKKNNYHRDGTLISDVWRDIQGDLNGDMEEVIDRFIDLFSIDSYKEFYVLDCRSMNLERSTSVHLERESCIVEHSDKIQQNMLLFGDCLEELKKIPDNSIDFAFADPPYNLRKKYNNYSDNLEISEYYDWCDSWVDELVRVLRPGRTLAILNIPVRAIRHFLYLEHILQFQNWIVWDALSFPVRKIMPANYSILCFSKGRSRKLPGLNYNAQNSEFEITNETFHPLSPMGEWYCRRKRCLEARRLTKTNDRGILSDVWWDIHRLRHNSRRVDHPTQLPPQLMYRLISIFTNPGEVVLDCFNGAGTSTLAAHQLGRKYVGIEISSKYYRMAQSRHDEIENNVDPFRKANRKLSEKNNGSRRLGKQKYEVPKNRLQLEVKYIAERLGHLPSRDELEEHTEYNIEYYDEYFSSWGEIYAAARSTGMNESREENYAHEEPSTQQPTLFDIKSYTVDDSDT